MSVQPATPPAVAAVVGGSQGAPANATDAVNDHTPDPETPPVVEHVPDPPRPDEGGLAQLSATVAGIATAVAALTETVTNMVAGKVNDASPARRPWTHIGSKDRDGE
jgi:hypothetical protein